MYVYRCEDTLESIFTAIYRVYEEHRPKDEVLLALDGEPRLFAEELSVVVDPEKSEKVARTLCRRFGMEDYERVCFALTAADEEKAQAVYWTIVRGLALPERSAKGRLFEGLGDVEVCKAFKLARSAERECCHLEGFLRFAELEKGALYAQAEMKNNLLPFLMAHFADRFQEESFLIHDIGREIAGVHYREAGPEEWFLVKVGAVRGTGEVVMATEDIAAGGILREGAAVKSGLSGKELYYQELFRQFCQDIHIRERTNAALQRQLLPLHFRKYMTEF
ncbi:MAG: TIGR03915 family putative DNA repair protein [Lachnospiraceae bacterium]|nr:TIGR03915 family putative DNA repair protein [Lachnospiraceae bacterium]